MLFELYNITHHFIVIFLALTPGRVGFHARNNFLSIGAGFIWALLIVAGVVILIMFYMQGSFDEFRFVQRLQGMAQESDSSLEARGYFVFLEGSTLQIVFGL